MTLARLAALLVLTGAAALAACAARGAGATGDLATDGFAWSERRLSWSDFRGAPPPGIPNIALTAYRWSVSVECQGPASSFQVQSIFLPRMSWVASPLMTSPRSSRRALQHEQTHFDLSEVHARMLRQFLSGLADPCDASDDALKELTAPFLREDADAQQRYDEETLNGRDEFRQAEWDEDVARRLSELSAFAD